MAEIMISITIAASSVPTMSVMGLENAVKIPLEVLATSLVKVEGSVIIFL